MEYDGEGRGRGGGGGGGDAERGKSQGGQDEKQQPPKKMRGKKIERIQR